MWLVQYNKAGDFGQTTRAFELSGHTAGVYEAAFNCDTTRIATISKDGTWKVFNINGILKNRSCFIFSLCFFLKILTCWVGFFQSSITKERILA